MTEPVKTVHRDDKQSKYTYVSFGKLRVYGRTAEIDQEFPYDYPLNSGAWLNCPNGVSDGSIKGPKPWDTPTLNWRSADNKTVVTWPNPWTLPDLSTQYWVRVNGKKVLLYFRPLAACVWVSPEKKRYLKIIMITDGLARYVCREIDVPATLVEASTRLPLPYNVEFNRSGTAAVILATLSNPDIEVGLGALELLTCVDQYTASWAPFNPSPYVGHNSFSASSAGYVGDALNGNWSTSGSSQSVRIFKAGFYGDVLAFVVEQITGLTTSETIGQHKEWVQPFVSHFVCSDGSLTEADFLDEAHMKASKYLYRNRSSVQHTLKVVQVDGNSSTLAQWSVPGEAYSERNSLEADQITFEVEVAWSLGDPVTRSENDPGYPEWDLDYPYLRKELIETLPHYYPDAFENPAHWGTIQRWRVIIAEVTYSRPRWWVSEVTKSTQGGVSYRESRMLVADIQNDLFIWISTDVTTAQSKYNGYSGSPDYFAGDVTRGYWAMPYGHDYYTPQTWRILNLKFDQDGYHDPIYPDPIDQTYNGYPWLGYTAVVLVGGNAQGANGSRIPKTLSILYKGNSQTVTDLSGWGPVTTTTPGTGSGGLIPYTFAIEPLFELPSGYLSIPPSSSSSGGSGQFSVYAYPPYTVQWVTTVPNNQFFYSITGPAGTVHNGPIGPNGPSEYPFNGFHLTFK